MINLGDDYANIKGLQEGEFERLPASRILCRLIRRGLDEYKGNVTWIDE